MREVTAAAEKHRAVLDEVTEPRVLHGDLWTVNAMMEPDTAEPRISGVFDNDRTVWGDLESDWTIYTAAKKPGTERDAFWGTYGARPATPGAAVRSLFYLAKHTGAIRLERQRLGNTDAVSESYEQMRGVLDQLLRA
ncbi:phosphotransferase [Saccharopolyspora hattusasensis]|uniref:phosphotransferase n=1 Tax=Saccharopolyspora hattusasensis TaxID=1128679 RepID=UPI003D98E02F